ncbi:hypothetical protein IT575_08030 [bacterium]|nr:hypothetical protein [bacterium]
MHSLSRLRSVCSGLRLLAALAVCLGLLSGCPAGGARPAQIEVPAETSVGRDLPGRVYKPFDQVYPPQWPADLRLPAEAYTLGPISSQANPEAATQQLQEEMVAYALVPGEAAGLRAAWAVQLREQGFQLLEEPDSFGGQRWTGKAYRQRPDGLWLGIVLRTDGDTGREGWSSLAMTLSLHKDLSGAWQGQPGSSSFPPAGP